MCDVSKYTPFFHDGSIIGIQHRGSAVELFMESAEVDPEEIRDVVLSARNTIKGILHVSGVEKIQENNQDVLVLEKKYDDGGIFDFELEKHRIEFSVDWVNFPPYPAVNEFSVIQIVAEKIWWENVPDLVDPYW